MSKRKGTKVERDMLSLFWNTSDWAAIRAPGSGSARFPSPDILAGNSDRTLAIECKFTQKKSQYLTKEEIEQLKEFSRRFNAEPWVAIKFGKESFVFLSMDDMEETPKFYVVSMKTAKLRGLALEDLIKKS